MKLVDEKGETINKRALLDEMAGPTVAGVRSVMPTWTTRRITPDEMAAALQSSETPGNGSARAYLELAERMEETYMHYAGVLQTRKRAVSRIPVRIEPADDSAEALRDAELAETAFKRSGVRMELRNILDAVGKGFSATEIIWETSEKQWAIRKLAWRQPQWFDYDQYDGTTLTVRTESGRGWEPLPPYKIIEHRVMAKSGLPIRGGLARLACWAWLFHAFTLRDWMRFVEAYGLPVRLGKYGRGASDEDKRILWQAVSQIAGDAAAIIPDSMVMEFIDGNERAARSDIFDNLIGYLDRQISVAVIGQTLTTEEGSSSGSYAQAKVHDQVREDIEEDDGDSLAETLREQVVIPLITLNHGPRERYPSVHIRRERLAELTAFSESLAHLVPLGLRVRADEVRDRLGMSMPGTDDEILMPGGVTGNMQTPAMAQARIGLAQEIGREADPLLAALDAIDGQEWQRLTSPLIQPILDRALSDPDELMSDLAGLYPELDAGALQTQLARIIFVADTLGRLNNA